MPLTSVFLAGFRSPNRGRLGEFLLHLCDPCFRAIDRGLGETRPTTKPLLTGPPTADESPYSGRPATTSRSPQPDTR